MQSQCSRYGKCSISSNTLAVRTAKFILKLLFKTFSFSSNSDFFYAFDFLILRTHTKNLSFTEKNFILSGVLFSRHNVQRDVTQSQGQSGILADVYARVGTTSGQFRESGFGRVVLRRIVRCTVGVGSDMRDSSRELFYISYDVSSFW